MWLIKLNMTVDGTCHSLVFNFYSKNSRRKKIRQLSLSYLFPKTMYDQNSKRGFCEYMGLSRLIN